MWNKAIKFHKTPIFIRKLFNDAQKWEEEIKSPVIARNDSLCTIWNSSLATLLTIIMRICIAKIWIDRESSRVRSYCACLKNDIFSLSKRVKKAPFFHKFSSFLQVVELQSFLSHRRQFHTLIGTFVVVDNSVNFYEVIL